MALPDPVLEQGFEDTQSIESDIEVLYTKFIKPIEKIRSIAQATAESLSNSDKSQLRSNLAVAIGPVESRAHAFYRLLGFPVVDSQGNLYNPGFNPEASNDKKNAINTNQDAKKTSLMKTRESHAQYLQKVFNNQDLASSVYALVIASQPKLFFVFDKDEQTFKISERDLEVDIVARDNPNLSSDISTARSSFANTPINTTMDGGLHILKPFQVNPTLEFTVMPSNNWMAAPFLQNADATRSSASPEIIHDRPGIEYIIRVRLQDTTRDPYLLTALRNILNQEKSPNPTFINDVNTDVLKNTLFALADQNNINKIDVNDIFQTTTSTEADIIEQLIKTIKVVTQQLHTSVTELDKIRRKINFLPIVGITGPESLGTIKDTTAITKIDNQILQLTIKKLNAESQVQINKGLGNFATPFLNLEKTNVYDQQLSQLTQLKTSLGNTGLRHLRTIEIITGEISGLGLIDILAIYTALWSIKLEDILGLLDQDSFDRLYNFNPALRAGPVANKSRSSVNDALATLETRVGNILSFADKIYADSLNSPQESDKGNI